MRIALLSTSDTDLLSARSACADYVWGNPSRLSEDELHRAVEGADLVVARILGSPHDLGPGFDELRAGRVPLVMLGGEQQPSAELMELGPHAYHGPGQLMVLQLADEALDRNCEPRSECTTTPLGCPRRATAQRIHRQRGLHLGAR